jgi:hypothetical protein
VSDDRVNQAQDDEVLMISVLHSHRFKAVPPGRDDPNKNFTKSSCLPNAWLPIVHAADLIRLWRKHL